VIESLAVHAAVTFAWSFAGTGAPIEKYCRSQRVKRLDSQAFCARECDTSFSKLNSFIALPSVWLSSTGVFLFFGCGFYVLNLLEILRKQKAGVMPMEYHF
jgi:hypothetical protein